jgi:hypothetical protein
MEKALLKRWSIIGVFITYVLAAGWHFLYSDVMQNGVTAAIAPVNESPWEHAKLFFVPAIIFYLVLFIIAGKKFPNFLFSHTISLLLMPVMMLILFYAYQLVIPESFIVDLILTFVVIALGQLIAYRLTISKLKLSGAGFNVASAVIVLAMLAVYIAFTYNPPHWIPFQDPEDMHFGIR